jgi:Transcriptional regulator PadR-like family
VPLITRRILERAADGEVIRLDLPQRRRAPGEIREQLADATAGRMLARARLGTMSPSIQPYAGAMSTAPIIADRGEFIDVLRALSRGRVLVQLDDHLRGCAIDGSVVYRSCDTLHRYGLIREFNNPDGFPAVRYYRITERGHEFAQRACAAWRAWPLLQRLATRLLG